MKTYSKKDYTIKYEAINYYLICKKGSSFGLFKIDKEQLNTKE